MKPENVTIPEQETMIFSGRVIAQNVSYEDYLSGKFGAHAEWIYGIIIAMSPISIRHDLIQQFLVILFRTYLEFTTGGVVLTDPVVMRPGEDFPARQPDIQVILPDRMDSIQENQVAGAANLVVEIVSPESVKRDRGEKFHEYERGGVEEYWLLDPVREEALFYVRDENGIFRARPAVEGIFTSHVLSRLSLPVSLFWQEKLPSTREIVHMVEVLLK